MLGEGVLDGHDRIALDPAQKHELQLACGERALLQRKRIAPAAIKLTRRDIEGNGGVDAGLEAGISDRPDELGERFLVRLERRPVAALVGNALQGAALCQPGARGVIDLRAPFQGFGEAACADADHHVVLHVHPAARVRAAAEDLDLRHGKRHPALAGEMAPQRHLG